MIINITILLVMIIAAYIDIKKRIIPDCIHLMLLVLGAIKIITAELALAQSLLGFFVIGIPLLVIGLFTNGIGGGDIKLCACTGFALGWDKTVLALLLSLFLFILFSGILKIQKKKAESLAFAPFMAFGSLIFIFW